MPIICATNLFPQSVKAATVAAAVAARLNEPLWLYGIFDREPPSGDTTEPLAQGQRRLEAEAERLRALGVTVRAVYPVEGAEALLEDEECQRARWLVLAAEGWHATSRLRASLPERLARRACAPLLMVRRDEALADWARGRRRLLVVAGVDAQDSAAGPLGFLRELRAVGPCDVVATYVCSPAEERERLGIHSPVHVEKLDPVVRHMEKLDPRVERVLLRELHERMGELPGEGALELHLEPGYGRRADHLLHVAHERKADLLVVGTHQRGGLSRLWHGSVSAGVLRHAEQSVVCVPPAPAQPRRVGPPRSVLVPVDFSPGSARAVAQARTVVAPGGRVHLLHVHRRRLSDPAEWVDHDGVLPEPPGEQETVLARLRALVPREDSGVHWTVEGVSGEDIPKAICQASEREGADLVCVGAPEGHSAEWGRGVVRELMARCRRPVMVVPARPEGREPPEWVSETLPQR